MERTTRISEQLPIPSHALATRRAVLVSPVRYLGPSLLLLISFAGSGLNGVQASGDPACTATPSGLVAWWPLDGDATDLQGNHDGTIVGNGAAFPAGMVDSGFKSGGQGSLVSVPDTPSLEVTSFTLEAWIRVDALNSLSMDVVWKGNSLGSDLTSPYGLFVLGSGSSQPGQAGFLLTNGISEVFITNGTPLPIGQFVHVAATYDGSVARLYVDGLLAASTSVSLIPLNSSFPFQIGSISGALAANYFNGIIDEVGLFSRALSASEIQAIYDAGSGGKCRPVCTPAPSGMVSWWPGDGHANDIQDGNPGTLHGAATFAPGKVGQAFSFDGVSYVRVPHNANLDPGTGSFTLTAWVETTSIANKTLVSKYECGGFCPSGGANSLYFLSMSAGKVVAEIRDSDGSSPGELFLTGSSPIADGDFHHVAMLRDIATSQLRIYVDGVLDASAVLNAGSDGAIQDNDGEADPLLLGGFFNGGTTTLRDAFTGLIDEVEYFNRALSASEIQAIYAAGSAGKCKDEDGDGFRPPEDCDEADPAVNPVAAEFCEGVDNDCDGVTDEGFVLGASCTAGLGVCQAAGVTVCAPGGLGTQCSAVPGMPAADDSACNGLDDDCDAATDEDYASVPTSCGVGACTASGSTSCAGGSVVDSCTQGTPAADDSACNALDDDCDAATDEDYGSVSTSCGIGACAASGSTSCAGGSVVDSCTPGMPAADDSACNALDDDCDAATDEDYASVPTSCGVGACTASGSTSCSGGSEVDSCAPGTPAADDSTCDALDDDCDADTDEDYPSLPTMCGSGTCSSTGATDCIAGAEIDTCEPGVPGSEDVCDGGDDDCDAVTDEGFITVTATRHTTGPGSNPPANKTPISDLPVGVYDRSLNGCSGSCGPSDYACWVTSLGCAQVAQGTTNASGQVSFEIEPGLYLVIGDGGTTHKMGKHVDVACGETKSPDLREIVTPNGKVHAGKSSVRTGSYLLVIEPEAVVWSGEAEYYPFIFESLGDWGVTTNVAPPEGFVADHESLSAEVTSETEALQFVITDVGSDWVPTEVQHRLTHGARREVMRSKVGVRLHPELARRKGLDADGYRLDGHGRRIPEARPDPRVEKPAEIVGWVEPTAADPEWLIKVNVNVEGPVVVRLESGDGRHIRTLAGGRLEPGEHVLSWDGNDAAGKAPRAEGLSIRLVASTVEDFVSIVPSESSPTADLEANRRLKAEPDPIDPGDVLNREP